MVYEMSMGVSPEQMEQYQRNWRKRQERERQEMEARRERAWEVARQAADLLRGRFGASKVVVFGSLARGDLFHERSDVDLAAWGIDERDYLKAVSQLLDLDSTLEVNLVRIEEAREGVQAAIERDGKVI